MRFQEVADILVPMDDRETIVLHQHWQRFRQGTTPEEVWARQRGAPEQGLRLHLSLRTGRSVCLGEARPA